MSQANPSLIQAKQKRLFKEDIDIYDSHPSVVNSHTLARDEQAMLYYMQKKEVIVWALMAPTGIKIKFYDDKAPFEIQNKLSIEFKHG